MGSRGAGCKASISEEVPGGTSMKDVDRVPCVAAEAPAYAAIRACQMQRLPFPQQQLQCSRSVKVRTVSEMSLLGLRGGFRPVLGEGVSVPGSPARTV